MESQKILFEISQDFLLKMRCIKAGPQQNKPFDVGINGFGLAARFVFQDLLQDSFFRFSSL